MKKLLIAMMTVVAGASMVSADPCPEGSRRSNRGGPFADFEGNCKADILPNPVVVQPAQAPAPVVKRESVIAAFAALARVAIAQGETDISPERYVEVVEGPGCAGSKKELRQNLTEEGVRQDLLLYNVHFTLMSAHVSALTSLLGAYQASGGYLPDFAKAAAVQKAHDSIRKKYQDLGVMAKVNDRSHSLRYLLELAIDVQYPYGLLVKRGIRMEVIFSDEMKAIKKALKYLHDGNLADKLAKEKQRRNENEEWRRRMEKLEQGRRPNIGNKI